MLAALVHPVVPTPPSRRDRLILCFLCLFAGVHVFIFSAAFPFFNVVDEQLHFDLVVRYARGNPPRALEPPCAEAVPYIAIFGTSEYLSPPESLPGGRIAPPPWKAPLSASSDYLLAKENLWRTKAKNHEASQPPLYYSLAGAWWRLGRLLGLDGGQLLYWVRFLNIPLVAALVWLGATAARFIFPENRFIRLGVPAFIACLPQTTFYAINNDIASPLAFGAAFVLLLKIARSETLTAPLAGAAGLALAATFLAKMSNLPLLAVAGVGLGLKIWRLRQTHRLRPSLPALAWLGLAAGLPAAAWMTWCRIHFGDLTGSGPKVQFLNWTDKPLAEWLHHPLFTTTGFWYFLKGNLATFWQGEFLWQRRPLALPGTDWFFTVLTLVALAGTLVAGLRRATGWSAPQRTALGFSLACLAAGLAFFALLSVKYDFQDCYYPSREHPFFVSGRLLLGGLIPFLILLTCGLDQLMKRLPAAARWVALGALLSFMLASEIATDWNIFPNDYNWFHL